MIDLRYGKWKSWKNVHVNPRGGARNYRNDASVVTAYQEVCLLARRVDGSPNIDPSLMAGTSINRQAK